MLYIIILLYVVFLILNYDVNRRTKNRSFHIYLLLFILVFISGFGDDMGCDCINAIMQFDSITPDLNIRNYIGPEVFIGSQEPLWRYLMSLVKYIFGDFMYFKLVIAVFVNTTFFWFLRKHSTSFFTAVFVYLIFGFFNLNFEVLREAIAVSFFLIGLDKIASEKKNYFYYYLWSIPALFFHHFAFIIWLLPIVGLLKVNKWYAITAVVLFVASPLIPQLLFNLPFLEAGQASNLQYYYDTLKYGAKEESSLLFLIKITLSAIGPTLIILLNSKNQNRICVGCALAYVLVLLLTQSSLGVIYRLKNYLLIPTCIIIADSLIRSLFKGDFSAVPLKIIKNKIFYTLVIVYYLTISITGLVNSPLWPLYYPYTSVFYPEYIPERESIYSELNVMPD